MTRSSLRGTVPSCLTPLMPASMQLSATWRRPWRRSGSVLATGITVGARHMAG